MKHPVLEKKRNHACPILRLTTIATTKVDRYYIVPGKYKSQKKEQKCKKILQTIYAIICEVKTATVLCLSSVWKKIRTRYQREKRAKKRNTELWNEILGSSTFSFSSSLALLYNTDRHFNNRINTLVSGIFCPNGYPLFSFSKFSRVKKALDS